MRSKIDLYNTCKVSITKPDGSVQEKVFLNMTCNAGRGSLAKVLSGDNSVELGKIKYIAIGTGGTPAVVTDVALETEQYRSAILEDYTELSEVTLKVYARFQPWYAIDVAEAGLFIDATASSTNGSGTLLARSVFDTSQTKESDDAMTIEWTINVINAEV